MDFIKEYFKDIDTKAIIFGSMGFILIFSALFYGTFSLSTREPKQEEEQVVTTPITDDDKSNMSLDATTFLTYVGNFGYDFEKALNAKALDSIVLELKNNPNNPRNNYFISRAAAYNGASDYIFNKGPLSYTEEQTSGWSNDLEFGNTNRLYKISNINLNIPEQAVITNYNGENKELATITGTFDSEITAVQKTAFDSSWDGTYSVKKRTYTGNSFTLRMIKNDDKWEAFSIEDIKNPFLLSTWMNPDFKIYSTELSENYSDSGSLKDEEYLGQKNNGEPPVNEILENNHHGEPPLPPQGEVPLPPPPPAP